MIRRSTWVLLVMFVVLLGATMVWTRTRPAPGERAVAGATPTLAPLWSVPANEIVGLRLEDRESGTILELRRGDEATPWRMVLPVEGPADAGRVEWAVNSLLAPRPRGTISAPPDLEPYGLASPARQVTVFFEGSVSKSFALGRISPTGGVFYVSVPGQGDVILLNEISVSDVLSLLDTLPYPPTPTPSATSSPTATGMPGTPGA